MRERVLLQLAVALGSTVSVVVAGWQWLHAPIWVVLLAGAAGAAWVVRALVSARGPRALDLVLLAVMLVGSAAIAGPTYGVSLYPAAGSLVIVLGDPGAPRWTVWGWPIAATAAAAIGFGVGHAEPWSIAVVVPTLAIAALAGLSRRAHARDVARRFTGLDRAYAEELSQVQASVDRLLTSDSLRARYPGLTAREAETLALICRGRSNEEIAGDLVITTATVKGYVNSLFGKIPAQNRAHAIALVLGTAVRAVPAVTP